MSAGVSGVAGLRSPYDLVVGVRLPVGPGGFRHCFVDPAKVTAGWRWFPLVVWLDPWPARVGADSWFGWSTCRGVVVALGASCFFGRWTLCLGRLVVRLIVFLLMRSWQDLLSSVGCIRGARVLSRPGRAGRLPFLVEPLFPRDALSSPACALSASREWLFASPPYFGRVHSLFTSCRVWRPTFDA